MAAKHIEQLEGRQLLASTLFIENSNLGTVGAGATNDAEDVSLLEGEDAFGASIRTSEERAVRFKLTNAASNLNINLTSTDGNTSAALGNLRVRVVRDLDADGAGSADSQDVSELNSPKAEFTVTSDAAQPTTRQVKSLPAGDYYLYMDVANYGGSNQQQVNVNYALSMSAAAVTAPVVQVSYKGNVVEEGATIDFGNSTSAVITVKNVGGSELDLGEIDILHDDRFAVVEGLPEKLSAGQSETFTLQTVRSTPGTFGSTLSINSSDPENPAFGFALLATIAVPTGNGSIAGSVYNDLNDNGKRNPNEKGRAGIRVYIDFDNDGSFAPTEPSVLTDANGNYKITGLGAATYRVRQVIPRKWRLSAPKSGVFSVNLDDSQAVTKKNFGQTQKAVAIGRVFNDKNGNKILDVGEQGLRHAVVFVDLDKDNVLDKNEPRGKSVAGGLFLVRNVPSGKFKLNVAPKEGFKRTTKVLGLKVGKGGTKANVFFGLKPITAKNA